MGKTGIKTKSTRDSIYLRLRLSFSLVCSDQIKWLERESERRINYEIRLHRCAKSLPWCQNEGRFMKQQRQKIVLVSAVTKREKERGGRKEKERITFAKGEWAKERERGKREGKWEIIGWVSYAVIILVLSLSLPHCSGTKLIKCLS